MIIKILIIQSHNLKSYQFKAFYAYIKMNENSIMFIFQFKAFYAYIKMNENSIMFIFKLCDKIHEFSTFLPGKWLDS